MGEVAGIITDPVRGPVTGKRGKPPLDGLAEIAQGDGEKAGQLYEIWKNETRGNPRQVLFDTTV